MLHAISLSDGTIYPEHLPKKIRDVQDASNGSGAVGDLTVNEDERWMTLAEMETNYVLKVLKSTGNNKQAASRILNIDRKTLSRIAGRSPSSES
jgi:ActR/RegA family two-component response regulator